MDRELLYRALTGDQEAIELFGEAEHCAVIDWRDDFAQIVSSVQAFLPESHLTLERSADSRYTLLVRGKAPTQITLAPSVKQEELLAKVSEVLQPEFELRQFRPVNGDSYSVLVAPSAVWSEIESAHPQATERLFLPAARLAAHWRKGYLARLFSKP